MQIGNAGVSRPPARTVDPHRQAVGPVCTKTPQTVAGPVAGVKRGPDNLRRKRCTGSVLSMPITES